jgi:hypothetical protein
MSAQNSRYDIFEVLVPIVRFAKVLTVARTPEQAKAYVQYRGADGKLGFITLKDDESLALADAQVAPAGNRDLPLWKLLRERTFSQCEILGASHSGYVAHDLSDDERAEIMARAQEVTLRNVALRDELIAWSDKIDKVIESSGQRIIENASPEELRELDVSVEAVSDLYAALESPLAGTSAVEAALERLVNEEDVSARTELVRTLPALLEADTGALELALKTAKALYESLAAKASESAN